MPRPALTRSRIVVAGVAVVSEVGLPALDLRAVARRVNTTATGVQRHIGATELVESVVDEIVQSMPPMPGRGDWSRRVRLWAVQTRGWLVGYPGLARHLLVDRWHAVGLDRLDDVAGVLEETGLARAQRIMAASTLCRFVLCNADLDESTQLLGGKPPAGKVADSKDDRSAPIVPSVDRLATATDRNFAFGLDLLIEGIECRSADGLIGPTSARRSFGS
jgi:AcrR family transcriptional regulator